MAKKNQKDNCYFKLNMVLYECCLTENNSESADVSGQRREKR